MKSIRAKWPKGALVNWLRYIECVFGCIRIRVIGTTSLKMSLCSLLKWVRIEISKSVHASPLFLWN